LLVSTSRKGIALERRVFVVASSFCGITIETASFQRPLLEIALERLPISSHDRERLRKFRQVCQRYIPAISETTPYTLQGEGAVPLRSGERISMNPGTTVSIRCAEGNKPIEVEPPPLEFSISNLCRD
jgi:hypothetical protein